MTRKEQFVYMLLIPLVAAVLPIIFGWQTVARLSGWIPKDECSGAPVQVSLSSPADAVTIPYKEYGFTEVMLISTPVILETSRPVSEGYKVGVVAKGVNDTQYRLQFFHSPEWVSPTRIREDSPIIPVNIRENQAFEVRAIIVDTDKGFGEFYSEISQITNNKSLIAISDPITVSFQK